MERVVVVGASAAGLTAAETLRREGFAGQLTLVGDEVHQPYDRPPLSKQVLAGTWALGKAALGKTALRGQDALDKLGARWRLGFPAVRLDLAARRVHTADGATHDFDGLVIATGVTPRRLPHGHDLYGVRILRTLDDALELRAQLLARPRVVVVGAGFLGAEAAAVARQLGLSVTMVDPLGAPMIRQFGPVVANLLADLHRAHGVDVRMGTGVTGLDGSSGRVSGVRLDDGSTVPAELVLVSIGSTPSTGWLSGSGLSCADGVDCDEFGQAAPGVVAAGDVGNWLHPRLRVRVRTEHRMNATEQGAAAARTLLGNRAEFLPVPYFWTDQFDVKIQAYGTPGGEAEVSVVAGDPGTGRFAATYTRQGRVVAALGWNMPREARLLRQRVADDLAPAAAT